MKKLMIAAVGVAFTVGGVALPATASASASHPAAHHDKHHGKVQQHPCKGLGIDVAVGPKNVCIPL